MWRRAMLFAFTFVPGTMLCVACQYETAPPFPPELDLDLYAAEIAAIKQVTIEPESSYITIAGARIGPKGLYVDLLMKSNATDISKHNFEWLASDMSFLKRPIEFLDVRDDFGARLTLRPMRNASPPTVYGFIPMPIGVHYRKPPAYIVPAEEGTTIGIATCMWRTSRQLEPGEYRMQLVQWPLSSERYSSARLNPILDVNVRKMTVDDAMIDVATLDHVRDDTTVDDR